MIIYGRRFSRRKPRKGGTSVTLALAKRLRLPEGIKRQGRALARSLGLVDLGWDRQVHQIPGPVGSEGSEAELLDSSDPPCRSIVYRHAHEATRGVSLWSTLSIHSLKL
jgi:hypothetical protein